MDVALYGCGIVLYCIVLYCTAAAVRLLNVQQTGCHVDCETGFFRWINKNIDHVKVIKKMDYKLFVLKEQNRN